MQRALQYLEYGVEAQALASNSEHVLEEPHTHALTDRKMIEDLTLVKQSFASYKLLPLHPLPQNSSNLQTILLQEHHMSISMDTDIRQLEMLCGDARLLQELDRAPVIWRMVRRFSRHDQDRHLCEIDELSRHGGIGLDYAVGVQRRVRRDNVFHEVDRIDHGGPVG